MIHTDQGNPVQMQTGYSPDTQILTRRGWLPISQLDRGEQVATRNAVGEFQWRPATTRTGRADRMIHFTSRTTDLLVATGQPVLHNWRQRKYNPGSRYTELPPVERITLAGEMLRADRISLVATSAWRGGSDEAISLLPGPAERLAGRKPLAFSASTADFAAFMGMWLAEGHLEPQVSGEYPIAVSQTRKGRGFAAYQELLNRLLGREVPWYPGGHGVWHFRNKALYEYLAGCGKTAWTKRIPAEILNLPVGPLETFWYYYWLGDGTTMRSDGRQDIQSIGTTSRDIADGLQEVLQKLGAWSAIHPVKPGGRYGARPQYRLLRRAGAVASCSAATVTGVGAVMTITAVNPAVYVRRNDHPVWCCTT